MAIVVYKCDTCKRSVELIRNIKGLETVQRCVITHGCRGKLVQADLLEDFSRASIPDEVAGLDDWIPRRVLYNHTQTIANSVWIIPHNLGTFPSISVFADRPLTDDETNREEITPGDVQIIDPNNLLLRFDRPRSGIAQLVARSSDPQLFNPVPTAATETIPSIQISSSGRVVFATRVKPEWNATSFGVQLEFASGGQSAIVAYTADSDASAVTAWAGSDRVVIRGKSYQVREFEGVAAEMITGVVLNGNTFRFRGFDFNKNVDAGGNLSYEYQVDPTDAAAGSPFVSVLPSEVYILLASPPYDTADKITNQVIDITQITKSVNPYAMYYDSGEFYASESVLTSVFPSIRVL